MTELRGKGRSDFPSNTRRELAASAVGRHADLERAVCVGGEEGEGAEGGGVCDIHQDAIPSAELRDVCAYLVNLDPIDE
jgi:hypothetical protein